MGLSVEVSVSAAAVFAQGLLSFFSPCVLPLLPLYLGYLSGGGPADETPGRARARTMVNTLFFVLGVSAAFFLLGLGMSAVGRFLGAYGQWFARIGGVVVILLGLYQLGVLRSARLESERRIPLRLEKLTMSPWTALVMGFVFSFAWTPCVGPTLSGVLILAASAASRGTGFLLIGVYTLGFVIPFLAVGLFTTSLMRLFREHAGVVRYTRIIGGALLVIMGVLMLTGAMNSLSGALSRLTSDTAQTPSAAVVDDAAVTPEPTPASTPEPTPEPEPADEDVFPAYAFEMTDQYGVTHTLEDYRGRVIFLNVWATWCPYCVMEMPDIQSLYEKYGDNGDVAILGAAFPNLSGEGDEASVAAYLAENGFTYPTLMDTEGAFLRYYGISAFPTTFMIDADGNVYGYVAGMISLDTMEDIIRQTLEASGLPVP